MSASQHKSIDQRIAEEAAQWLIELEDANADLPRFTAWLEASPRHVEEFLVASAVWNAIDTIDDTHRIDVEQLLAGARDNVQSLDAGVPGPRRHDVPRRAWGPLGNWLIAAVAVLAVGCVLWFGLDNDQAHYATGVGEQRSFKLPDGSLVTLNTRSQIAVRFASEERLVELIAGEAMFSVEHDTQRPFRVLAGGASVQAVGTQFNVHRAADSTTVAVVEGIVQVSPLAEMGPVTHIERLVAGEQAQVSLQGDVLHHTTAEIERVVAWRERRLIFRDEPLGAIAVEFNRYNDTQLVVEGSATRARRMTGVFNADDPGALIAFLDRDPTLSVQSREGSVVIRGP